MNDTDRKIIAICGPTAVGKTRFAIEAALALGGEIISCDSMQLYQYMDIGSAKPTAEEQSKVRHYLVDQIDPRESFSVARYQKLAKTAIEEVFVHGKIPIIAGGTGLYLNSLLYDMDFSAPPENNGFRDAMYALAEEQGAAEAGNRVKDFASDPVPTKDYSPVLVGLNRDRQELYDRINRRVDMLMEQGLEQEVRKLLSMGLTGTDISMKGIGYKELIGYIQGEYDREEAVRLIKRNTRHLAKRQLTWFRRYRDMKWFSISEYESEERCICAMNEWLREQIKS